MCGEALLHSRLPYLCGYLAVGGEVLSCDLELNNLRDRYTVSVCSQGRALAQRDS